MSPEWGKYDQAKADADIAVHAALTTGVHGVGSSTIVGTDLTQTLTAKTLTSPTIQGTVLAGTGLTMPAFIAGGDISLGANKLIVNALLIKNIGNDYLMVRDSGDSVYKNVICSQCYAESSLFLENGAITLFSDTSYLTPRDADGTVFLIKARDTGVGLVEVARVVGAADPYFQATLPLRLLPIVTASLPGTPVEGMIAYDNTLNKLVVYNGSAWETVSSA